MNLLKRFRAIFNAGMAQADLNDELRFHLEKEVEQNITRGMSLRDLQVKFAAIRGVTSVSYSWTPLLNGWMMATSFRVPGAPEALEGIANILPVGPKFFQTMRILFKMGRDFSAAECTAEAARPSGPAAKPDPNLPPTSAIANEAFVRRYLSGKNPLGQHIEEAQPDDPEQSRGPGWQVIGVVGDAKYSDLREEMGPTFYTPSTSNSFFSIRTAGDPLRLASAIRDAVNRRDSSLAIYDMRSEAETIANSLFRERYLARFSSFFALLALLLACTGIYGLLSFEVARRTREIGVRMALGAQRVDAIRLVLGQGLRLALIGTLTGLAASLAVARLLADLLYRVHSFDALTLSGVSLLLLAVALAACYLPARQATRVDPLVALRYE